MAVSEITVRELEALGTGVRLIDVRERAEWEAGHVPYAVHVPLGTLAEQLDLFDGAPTYVICRSGGRSAHACQFAAANGYDAVNVTGGMLAWLGAGFDAIAGA